MAKVRFEFSVHRANVNNTEKKSLNAALASLPPRRFSTFLKFQGLTLMLEINIKDYKSSTEILNGKLNFELILNNVFFES